MIPFLRTLGFLSVTSAAAACTGSSGSTIGPGGGASGPVAPTCLDGAGKPTASCAVVPQGNTCSLGDANTCVALTKLEVYADDGKNGICLHLVYVNNCSQEIYADTCIEHATGQDGKKSWQCWTSSTPQGSSIDVDQCHATGNYFTVAATSAGALDIDEKKCPAPTP